GTLKVICDYEVWKNVEDKEKYYPFFLNRKYLQTNDLSPLMNFISIDVNQPYAEELIKDLRGDKTAVPFIWSTHPHAMASCRRFVMELMKQGITCPVIVAVQSNDATIDEQLIHFSTESGALFLEGMGDGIWLMNDPSKIQHTKVSGRTYLEAKNNHQF